MPPDTMTITLHELANSRSLATVALSHGLRKIIIRGLVRAEADKGCIMHAENLAMMRAKEGLDRNRILLKNSFLDIQQGYFDLHLEVAA